MFGRIGKILRVKNKDKEYLKLIENISYNPIFIMGLHRSGTTILYTLLNKTNKFTKLTTYHVIYYNQLIHNFLNKVENNKKKELNKIMKEKGIITRKFDKLKVGAEKEHEYVDIFLNNYYPAYLNEKNKELFDEICKKLKFISNNDKSILLKNPFDYPNFLKIKEFYPKAKFIFIHRNPLAVINSAMKTWKSHFSNKNDYMEMYSENYSKFYNNPVLRTIMKFYYCFKFPFGIFGEIIKANYGNKCYLENIDKLDKKDYVEITYENLCKNPNKNMKKIFDFLGIKTNIDYRKYISPRKLNLSLEVYFLKEYIYKKMKSYFINFGYDK